jgi:hypothetical protein
MCLICIYTIYRRVHTGTHVADGAHTKLTIDHDGTGVSGSLVTIILKNVAYSANLLAFLKP